MPAPQHGKEKGNELGYVLAMLLRDMALHLLFEFNLILYGWLAMTDKLLIDRELLPCPFCGGNQNASPELQHNPGCYFDVLASFKAAAKDLDFSLVPEVLKAWNRRAQPTPAGGRVGGAAARSNENV